VAWADADNDGILDLYLSKSLQANRLFQGTGGGHFVDATSGPLGDTGNGRGVAWADFNRDGRVDLFLANDGGPSRLFRNQGSLSFVDGAPDFLAGMDNTQGAAWGDYDNDNDPDLYVGNYGQPNRLLRNDGGTLVDVTSAPLADPYNTTGVAWGDVDTDGDLDLIVGNDMGPCRLLRNNGGGSFTIVTPADLAIPRPVYGVLWLDGDNDGDLDLFLNIANQPNRYYRNDGSFVLTHLATDMDDSGNGRGLAAADYDMDGDLDVYVANLGGEGKLFRNDCAYAGNWLEVRLTGVVSNRAAIGARVQVTATGPGLPPGGLVQIREVSGGSGYLSQNSLVAHFGLATATQVSQVRIRWPSGIVQDLGPLAVNQLLEITEASPGAVPPEAPPALTPISVSPNPFRSSTRISWNQESAGPVRAEIFDLKGRLVRRLEQSPQEAGPHEITWDGTDGSGRRVAAGAYFLQVDAAGRKRTVRVVVAR
jgi:hypothetical protein